MRALSAIFVKIILLVHCLLCTVKWNSKPLTEENFDNLKLDPFFQQETSY